MIMAGRQLSRIELCDISHIYHYMSSHACVVPHHLCACARAPVRPPACSDVRAPSFGDLLLASKLSWLTCCVHTRVHTQHTVTCRLSLNP